jgi:hypothetical protein
MKKTQVALFLFAGLIASVMLILSTGAQPKPPLSMSAQTNNRARSFQAELSCCHSRLNS